MKKKTLRDAYRAFHAEQFLLAKQRRAAAHREAAITEALVGAFVERLRHDAAFNRVLSRFTGHTPHGWSCACGLDGRMKDLLRTPGWGVLEEVIKRLRRERGIGRHYWRSGSEPNLTIEINIVKK